MTTAIADRAEQLPALAIRPATPRLDGALQQIGLECGGEPGKGLAGKLGITTSGDTILRRLRAMPLESTHRGNVIGVDDFAFRRGHHYGTIVVDHESAILLRARFIENAEEPILLAPYRFPLRELVLTIKFGKAAGFSRIRARLYRP